MFLFPILLVVLIYFLIGDKHRRVLPDLRQDEAMEQLKLRFANGEIDEETYLKMKATLKK